MVDEEENPNFPSPSSSTTTFVLTEDEEEGDSGNCAETLRGIRRTRFLDGEEGWRDGGCRKLRTAAMGRGGVGRSCGILSRGMSGFSWKWREWRDRGA